MDENKESTLVLTPSALFGFLSQIEELKDKEISFDEGEDQISIQIGESTYILESESDISDVSEELVDAIDDINVDCYAETVETEDEPVEGGIIKELIKTLAIGGLVRLTKNAIMSD